jgi:hypothetical protein
LKLPKDIKILIISESIDVEDSSGTKGRVALIKNLHKIGYNVVVYHYTRKEIQLSGIPCVAIKEKRWTGLFLLSRIERYLRYIFKIELNKPLEKIFGFSFTLFNDRNSIVSAIKNINNFEPDLIFTLSKGGSFRPHHALLKMPELYNKWVAYIHDPYPMHLYPRPYAWVEPGYMRKWEFIQEISKKAVFSAFPSKLLKEWMGSYFSGFLESGIIIPHQILESQINEVDFPEYFDPSKFNLLHAGNLLEPRNPKALVYAFKRVLKKFPEAEDHLRLLFLGSNNVFTSWLNKESEGCNSIVVSTGYVPFDTVLKMQNCTSVNVILEAKSEISPFLPGKFPHCIAAEKPILLLGPNFSESKRLLGENYEYWAEIDDVDRIAKIIESLYLLRNVEDTTFVRSDLKDYLSEKYLKEVVDSLIYKS